MLARFEFFHLWLVVFYGLLFIAIHLFLALGIWRLAGMRLPWAWAPRAAKGLAILALAGIGFGLWQRSGHLDTLQKDVEVSLAGICQKAAKLVVDMGGDTDDETRRAEVDKAVRSFFMRSATDEFAGGRYSPVRVIETGADPKWADLVVSLHIRRQGGDPEIMGCYNQYVHRYSGFSSWTRPYWRNDAGDIPMRDIVFFHQHLVNERNTVEYPYEVN